MAFFTKALIYKLGQQYDFSQIIVPIPVADGRCWSTGVLSGMASRESCVTLVIIQQNKALTWELLMQ
jgi:hypothetical protein